MWMPKLLCCLLVFCSCQAFEEDFDGVQIVGHDFEAASLRPTPKKPRLDQYFDTLKKDIIEIERAFDAFNPYTDSWDDRVSEKIRKHKASLERRGKNVATGAPAPACRKAVKFNAAQALALPKILELFQEMETKHQTELQKGKLVKVVKAVVGLGLFIAGIVLTPTAFGPLLCAGVGMAFVAAVSAYEAKMTLDCGGTWGEAAGAFVFNVAKGSVMTALGLEGITGPLESIVDLLCSSMVDAQGHAEQLVGIPKSSNVNAELAETTLNQLKKCSNEFEDESEHKLDCVVGKDDIKKGFDKAKSQEAQAKGEVKKRVEEFVVEETAKWASCGVWNTKRSGDLERDDRHWTTKIQEAGLSLIEFGPEYDVIMPHPQMGEKHWYDFEDDEE